MEERYRGVTASLTLVTMVALLVAFGSSSKRHQTEAEVMMLERQVQQLTRVNQTLEQKVRWVEGRYAQSMTLGKQLNQALVQEQEKNRRLALRLGSGQASRLGAPQDVPPAESDRLATRSR